MNTNDQPGVESPTPSENGGAGAGFTAAHGSADYLRHDRWREKERDEWLTPPEIIRALGDFDLDPASPRVRPWATAKHHYTIEDSGLMKPWQGRIWLNPPYGLVIGKWMARMAEHRNGVALIFARTESEYWHNHVWPNADALLFLRGRLKFYSVDGKQSENTGPAPSVLIAYGCSNVEALKTCGLNGALAYPPNDQAQRPVPDKDVERKGDDE